MYVPFLPSSLNILINHLQLLLWGPATRHEHNFLRKMKSELYTPYISYSFLLSDRCWEVGLGPGNQVHTDTDFSSAKQ